MTIASCFVLDIIAGQLGGANRDDGAERIARALEDGGYRIESLERLRSLLMERDTYRASLSVRRGMTDELEDLLGLERYESFTEEGFRKGLDNLKALKARAGGEK